METTVADWALSVALSVMLVGVLLTLRLAVKRRPPVQDAGHGVVVEMTCTECRSPLVVGEHEIRQIRGSEVALVVRVLPHLHGRPLGEYVCPHCDANHCFTLDGKRPEWVVVNACTPHQGGSLCTECRAPLARPHWEPGAYDGRLDQAPGDITGMGLRCSRCGAVCCVGCCRKATRKRTSDGSLLCPRCHRGPVQDFLHFA